jgi:uncharacterized protein YjiS (DUF1127 family)
MRISHVKPDKLSFAQFSERSQIPDTNCTFWRHPMTVAAHHSLTNSQLGHIASAVGRGGLTDLVDRTVGLWRSRIRERRVFASFDYRDLHDMGVSRWELERELAKPFWRG